jgi:lipoate-protein ligase A
MQNTVYFSNQYDPYYNLALEALLFDAQGSGCTLYLWQNENTVVIGKNQNAWKECRISLLEQEGGKLARRSSGGGAVFHDLGNLNFTFLMPRADYDVKRQLSVIQNAAASFGIETDFTGRNDLVVRESGAKFSGNAFRFTNDTAMHHGTVLIKVNMEKLARYLAPSPDKLASKGVESVRARVQNLADINPAVTVETMKRALLDSFVHVYGPARVGQDHMIDYEKLNALREQYASWEWRMGRTPSFDITLERRFAWGNIEMQLSLRQGAIVDAKVYSDAMDEAFIERIAPMLLCCPFRSCDIAERLNALRHPQAAEIADWILEKGF